MTIVVDSREPTATIITPLVSSANADGIEVRQEALDAGDFVTGDYIIERKRYDDFVHRMLETEVDVWDQMMAVRAAAEELDKVPVLLMEGGWESTLRHVNISSEQLTKAIASVVTMDCVVAHTFDHGSTVNFVMKLADSREHSTSRIRETPSVPDELIPRYMVEGVPGVGPSKAQKLLDEFGTPLAVFNADVSELTSVSGIGTATAQRVQDAVRTE
jgi:ERCC4-type nuclease